MKKSLIILVLVAALLYVTNPSKEDFSDWTKARMEERMEESAKENGIQEALSGTLSEIGSAVGAMFTEEKNYYLFSIYTVDLGKKEYSYLGVFKVFIPLQTDNPLDYNE